MLRTLHKLGLDSHAGRSRVKGVDVAPRDVVAAVLPDPAHVGDRMKGRAIVGTWVIGRKDGKPREVYLYQKTVAEETWRDWQAPGRRLADRLQPGRGHGAPGQRRLDRLGRGRARATSTRKPVPGVLDRWGIHWALDEREPGANIPT